MITNHFKPTLVQPSAQRAQKFGIHTLGNTEEQFKKPAERSGVFRLFAEPQIQKISDDWMLMTFKGEQEGQDTFKLVNGYEQKVHEGTFSANRLTNDSYRANLVDEILTAVGIQTPNQPVKTSPRQRGKFTVQDFTTGKKIRRPENQTIEID
jgi:hypothetical protein